MMRPAIYRAWTLLLLGLACMPGTGQAATTGTEHTLVILIHDVANSNTLPSVATMESRLETVSSNYQEYSYNMLRLGGVLQPAGAADVVGWYEYSGAAEFDLWAFMSMANTNAGVDFTRYGAMIVIVAARPGSTLSGWSTIGKMSFNTPDGWVYMGWTKMSLPNASATILTHEFGHIFGNGESSFLDCGDAVISATSRAYVTYGDPYDVMSSTSSGHFNARIKERSGWFSGSNTILNVTTSGVYAVEPIESDTGGLKALKIQRATDEYLYVEYRQPIGTDSGFSPSADVFQGALFHAGIHLLNMTPPALPYGPLPPTDAELTPTLHPGQSFTDPATGHRFTVLEATNTHVSVEIEHSGFEFNVPSVQLLCPSNGVGTLSGIFLLSALATDDSLVNRVEFWYVRDFNSLLLAATTNHGPDNVFSLLLDSVGAIPNGEGLIKARAYDQYGNQAETPTVAISVSNATDLVSPTVVIDAPTAGSTTPDNMVHIQATASDNQRLWKVEICADGNWHSPIYSGISTAGVHTTECWIQSGPHRLQARAYDFEGNADLSPEVNFDVITNADTVMPWGCFTSPSNGEVVSGPVWVALDAGDNVAVTSVQFFAIDSFDPAVICTNSPCGFLFDSATESDGYHHFRAQVLDSSGNQSMAQIMFEIRQDADGDGMPDWWERQCLGGTNAAAEADADGDRMSNLAEYIAGTCPTNAASRLQVSGFGFQDNTNFVLSWSSVTNKWYAIRTSTNLLSGFDGWAVTNILATPTINTQTVIVDQVKSRYYRVTVE